MKTLLVSNHLQTDHPHFSKFATAAKLPHEQISICPYEEAAVSLEQFKPDIVLPHFAHSEKDALAQVESLRHLTLDLPIVVVGDVEDERLALFFIREGVQDVFFLDTLEDSNVNRMLQFAIERNALMKRAQFYAYHDSLTGLPNRALFRDRLMQQLEISRRQNSRFAVHAIDLDLFKDVNDQHGHACGDALLRVVGERLTNTIRSVDTVARIGGDEFLIIQTSLESEDAIALTANRLLTALSTPIRVEEKTLQIHGTIGIAVCPDHGQDSDLLCRRADAALYFGKKTGRNVFCQFTEDMEKDSDERDVRVSIASDATPQMVLS